MTTQLQFITIIIIIIIIIIIRLTKLRMSEISEACGTWWGKIEIHTEFWCGYVKEEEHLGDVSVDRRFILKWILDIEWEGVAWSTLDSSGLGPEKTKMVMSSGLRKIFRIYGVIGCLVVEQKVIWL